MEQCKGVQLPLLIRLPARRLGQHELVHQIAAQAVHHLQRFACPPPNNKQVNRTILLLQQYVNQKLALWLLDGLLASS